MLLSLALLELEVQEHGHVNEVQVALFLPVQNQYSLIWFFQVICTSFQEYVRGYVHLHPRVVFHTYDLTFGDHLTVRYKVEECHHSVMQNVLIFSARQHRGALQRRSVEESMIYINMEENTLSVGRNVSRR